MSKAAPDELLDRLAEELLSVSGLRTSRRAVEEVLLDSFRDLAGSVSTQSMPEMAARLAATRIGIRPGGCDAATPVRTVPRQGPRSRPSMTAASDLARTR